MTNTPKTQTSFDLTPYRGAQTDAVRVSTLLDAAARQVHLVAPAPAVASVPDGCAISFSTVAIDPEAETYKIAGGGEKRGLSKCALDKIAHAAGVSWDAYLSRRLDDGSDPRYVDFVAVGRYRQFDGSVTMISGRKVMDLRDGSATVAVMHDRSKGGDATREISQMRSFILEHAETKARLRAIRSLGIRTSYSQEDLAKPFVVARLALTGNFRDASTRAHFNNALTASFLDAGAAMYRGADPGRAEGARALAGPSSHVSALPPPVDPDDPEDVPPPAQSAPERPAAPSQPASPPRGGGGGRPLVIPGGRSKGTPIENAEDADLVYWRDRIAKGLDDGSSKYPDSDRRLLAGIVGVIAQRAAPPAGSAAPAQPPAGAAYRVPPGFPETGKPIDDPSVSRSTLETLAHKLAERIDGGLIPADKRAAADAMLSALMARISALSVPASDDDFLDGLGDAP